MCHILATRPDRGMTGRFRGNVEAPDFAMWLPNVRSAE